MLVAHPVPGRVGDEDTHNQITPLAPSHEDTPPGQVSGVGKHAYSLGNKDLVDITLLWFSRACLSPELPTFSPSIIRSWGLRMTLNSGLRVCVTSCFTP